MSRKSLFQASATTLTWLLPLSALAASDIRVNIWQGDLISGIMAVINGILMLVGIAALIVLIIGGVQYITSAGDDGKVEKAKNTVLYAVVGVIVVALSLAITRFVANLVAGT